MDVNMPGLDGLAWRNGCGKKHRPAAFHFCDSLRPVCRGGFPLEAMDYLLKPLDRGGWPRPSTARGASS